MSGIYFFLGIQTVGFQSEERTDRFTFAQDKTDLIPTILDNIVRATHIHDLIIIGRNIRTYRIREITQCLAMGQCQFETTVTYFGYVLRRVRPDTGFQRDIIAQKDIAGILDIIIGCQAEQAIEDIKINTDIGQCNRFPA